MRNATSQVIIGTATLILLLIAVDSVSAQQPKKPKWKVESVKREREYNLPEPSRRTIREYQVRRRKKVINDESAGAKFYLNLLLKAKSTISYVDSTGSFKVKIEPTQSGLLLTRSNITKAQIDVRPHKYLVTTVKFRSKIGNKDLGGVEYLLRFKLLDDMGELLGKPIGYYQINKYSRALLFEGDFTTTMAKYVLEDPEGQKLDMKIE